MSQTDDLKGAIEGPQFQPEQVRYIKLGAGGAWAQEAIRDGTIPFGYREVAHEACAEGDWDEVRRQLLAMGRTSAGASQGLRELREFYTLPDTALWVTVADGHLWWAFAEGQAEASLGTDGRAPARFRRTRDGWHRDSLTGEKLTTRTLSSALTKTANYRMTICEIEHADYLLRRIRGEAEPIHLEAQALRGQMRDVALRMIAKLHWEEFETLVDLIFTHGGWRRSSVLGKNQADVDLILDHPLTRETAWVQVKSDSNQTELDDYLGRFARDGSCDRFFFVSHARKPLTVSADRRFHLWTGDMLADITIDAGLFDWLIQRTR